MSEEVKFDFILNIQQTGDPTLLLNNETQEFGECWGYSDKNFDNWVDTFFTHLENKFNTRKFTVTLVSSNDMDMDKLEKSYRDCYGDSDILQRLKFNEVSDTERNLRDIQKDYRLFFKCDENPDIGEIIIKYNGIIAEINEKINNKTEDNQKKNEEYGEKKSDIEEQITNCHNMYESKKSSIVTVFAENKEKGIALIKSFEKKCNNLSKIKKIICPQLQNLEMEVQRLLEEINYTNMNSSSFIDTLNIDELFLKHSSINTKKFVIGSRNKVDIDEIYNDFVSEWEDYFDNLENQVLEILRKKQEKEERKLNKKKEDLISNKSTSDTKFKNELDSLNSDLEEAESKLDNAKVFNDNKTNKE